MRGVKLGCCYVRGLDGGCGLSTVGNGVAAQRSTAQPVQGGLNLVQQFCLALVQQRAEPSAHTPLGHPSLLFPLRYVWHQRPLTCQVLRSLLLADHVSRSASWSAACASARARSAAARFARDPSLSPRTSSACAAAMYTWAADCSVLCCA